MIIMNISFFNSCPRHIIWVINSELFIAIHITRMIIMNICFFNSCPSNIIWIINCQSLWTIHITRMIIMYISFFDSCSRNIVWVIHGLFIMVRIIVSRFSYISNNIFFSCSSKCIFNRSN